MKMSTETVQGRRTPLVRKDYLKQRFHVPMLPPWFRLRGAHPKGAGGARSAAPGLPGLPSPQSRRVTMSIRHVTIVRPGYSFNITEETYCKGPYRDK